MSDRVVAVLARPSASLPPALAAAMLEDVVDLVTDTALVAPALAVAEGYDVAAAALIWPGTLVVKVVAEPTLAELLAAVAAAVEAETPAIAVVAADVPDLPTLLLGKLFSALAGPRGAAVAVCPAEGGGLVAVAVTTPIAAWLVDSPARLDDPEALDVVRRTAPTGALSVGPGWRRVREPSDVAHLDPGLEGWDATRTLLASPETM